MLQLLKNNKSLACRFSAAAKSVVHGGKAKQMQGLGTRKYRLGPGFKGTAALIPSLVLLANQT